MSRIDSVELENFHYYPFVMILRNRAPIVKTYGVVRKHCENCENSYPINHWSISHQICSSYAPHLEYQLGHSRISCPVVMVTVARET